jgi:dolichyl-phosphate beta-glucosyltransferase
VRFASERADVGFLFTNDGSRDGTASMLDRLCASNPQRFEALHLERNGGKAEAVRRGMLAAASRTPSPAAVGFWDADLATPLDEIPPFIAVLESRPAIEMVFGSRVNLLGRYVRRNLMRHYIGRIFATLASWMLGLGIYDTQCGAKLFRNNQSLRGLLTEPFLSRWIFDVEILARLIRDRRAHETAAQPEDVIVEQPLMRWIDVSGSKLKAKDFFTVAGDLLRIRRRYLRGVPRRRLSP